MATTATLTRPLTYDDLAARADDGTQYELIAGELFMSPSPNEKHQFSSGELFSQFRGFVMPRRLGLVLAAPFQVKLDEHNVVEPDILFLSRARRHLRRDNFIAGAPDLVVEILSPSTRGHDLVKKAAVYATFGVREYWIVDPEAETIQVQVLRDGRFVPVVSADGIARSEVLPGFAVNPVGLFTIPAWMTDEAGDVE